MTDEEKDNTEDRVATGFDRGIDFNIIKYRLIHKLTKLYKKYQITYKSFKRRILLNQMCYIIIGLIQLKNGSRISEACAAFKRFLEDDDIDVKVIVKIAKSGGIKYNPKTKEKRKTKSRYRQMIFPDWINRDLWFDIKTTKPICRLIKSDRLEKRVLDYLLSHFDTNCHSLRYACINHLLTDQKIPMATVSKFVGHINVMQLVTYTQQKEVNKVFDLPI